MSTIKKGSIVTCVLPDLMGSFSFGEKFIVVGISIIDDETIFAVKNIEGKMLYTSNRFGVIGEVTNDEDNYDYADASNQSTSGDYYAVP